MLLPSCISMSIFPAFFGIMDRTSLVKVCVYANTTLSLFYEQSREVFVFLPVDLGNGIPGVAKRGFLRKPPGEKLRYVLKKEDC